jgi:hypothetical protein
MVARPPLFQRHNPTKAKPAKIEPIDKSVNRANRIGLGHVVVKHGWEKCALAPVNPLHIARHPPLPSADSNKRIIASVRLSTQPGPGAVVSRRSKMRD